MAVDVGSSELPFADIQFSHVQFYCDTLKPVDDYHKLQEKLNVFVADGATRRAKTSAGAGEDVTAGRKAWLTLGEKYGDPVTGSVDPDKYQGAGQDLVEQLIVGVGWRMSGADSSGSTHSIAMESPDPRGVKFVLTAHKTKTLLELSKCEPETKRAHVDANKYDHFDASHIQRFAMYHNGRMGVAVLGFDVPKVGGIEQIRARYAALHPKLLVTSAPIEHADAKILEVYAYYVGDDATSDADPGTVLRFVERCASTNDGKSCVLPGLVPIEPAFDGVTKPAFCDHWVSNVFSRTSFLATLKDTLGFVPKVHFNAGVVAAGEAQIESTVSGNSPSKILEDEKTALTDQSQVYMPINNALSEFGHVHIYLQEMKQGIQHIASRVEDLAAVIQRANDMRKMTGAGLSFLMIPRSYYGFLTAGRLAKDADLDAAVAATYVDAVQKAGLADGKGIVKLEATREEVAAALPKDAPVSAVDHILRARYGNLYQLLREHITEDMYLRIVRNNILVDIQGDDLLLQIFTAKVLQRKHGEESCFLEFIQRVCSRAVDKSTGKPRPIKPGCGGFGIRNFLTLFLSIEVSTSSAAYIEAVARGDAEAAAFAKRCVEVFTDQLDESNPILTKISDAMTAEGVALEMNDLSEADRWKAEKSRGNEELQITSTKYKELMKTMREAEKVRVAA
jgi:hypothetical protein|eukprot:TRINITY_DN4706_c0_g1_i1.p1 TRINITY_DN4706_c0_g1~~TRINITY_DN4706_c0_g1_i1.p1  ORF type:complete len:697 (+),score=119.39 TRINITY_DN4706_c0_g1_i1:61-2091(+)